MKSSLPPFIAVVSPNYEPAAGVLRPLLIRLIPMKSSPRPMAERVIVDGSGTAAICETTAKYDWTASEEGTLRSVGFA